MSSALQIKPEDIDTPEKRERYTIGIVGCGQVGIFHAWLSAEKGFKIYCADTDRTMISNIAKGKIPFMQREIALKLRNHVKNGLLNITTDVKFAASQSHIIVITVPADVDNKKKIDYSKMENACKHVGLGLHHGSLIIITSVVGVGATQSLRENLENSSGIKCGADFGLAYSPVQSSNGQTLETIEKGDRIVAALDENSLNAASTFLETIIKGNVKKTLNVKMAEAVTLFEAVQNDVNYALAREFAIFCEKAGVDYVEAAKLKGKDARINELSPTLFNDTPFREPYILIEDSENLNLKARIPKVAREINMMIAKHATNLIKDALKNCSKTLRRARITLLGVTNTKNTKSPPKNIAIELIGMLTAKGVRLSVYDPYISLDEASEIPNFKKNLVDALEGADCVAILTGHDEFKHLNLKELKVVMKMPAAVVDFDGIMEPFEVEREGFIYRGLGRGV
jgi:UDP-N-acetyl-D-mannosaminuronic acid dehydrogenase